MGARLAVDVRTAVFEAAKEEAEMRGQDRVGSDHLLLALLREPGGVASRVLGIDVEQGRRALEVLDASALASVGVQAGEIKPAVSKLGTRVRFTEGAKSALVRSVHLAKRQKAKEISSRHLVAGLMEADAPEPVVAILRTAGIDAAEAKTALRDLT